MHNVMSINYWNYDSSNSFVTCKFEDTVSYYPGLNISFYIVSSSEQKAGLIVPNDNSILVSPN